NEYFGWLADLAVTSGVTTTFGVLGHAWQNQLEIMAEVERRGGRMVGQGHSRGVNTVGSFRAVLPFDRLPVWDEFRRRTIDAQPAGLRDPATRAALEDAVKNAVYGRVVGAEARPPQWDKFWVYDKPLPPWRTMAEIAIERGVHPITALIDIALASDLDALFMQPLTMCSDEDTVTVLRDPRMVMTFSDAGAHVGQIADASIQSHLIAYFCREKQLLSLPETVAMITSRLARAWNFKDRGVIREGAIADINVFDPQTFGPELPEVAHDLPTGARRLTQKARGMKATLVAGEVLIEGGEHTGALPGRLIRRLDS
ncbi:MAG: amidohydrolase family protein, partial [Sphingomonadales bacterium]|nr:amidohydrolase family protein [Sphingomonadales bacterium]